MATFNIDFGIDVFYTDEPEGTDEICNQEHDDDQTSNSKREHHQLLGLGSICSLWVFVVVFNKSFNTGNVQKSNEFCKSEKSDQLCPHNVSKVLERKGCNEIQNQPPWLKVLNSNLFGISNSLESFRILILGKEVKDKISYKESHNNRV